MQKIYSSAVNFNIDVNLYKKFSRKSFPTLQNKITNPLLSSLTSTFFSTENHFPLKLGKNKDIIIPENKWNLFKNEHQIFVNKFQAENGNYRRKKIENDQLDFIIDKLPKIVQSYIFESSLQITFFNGLWPHTDHYRSCSLICNLTDSEFWTTSWYECKKNNLQLEAAELGFFWPWAPSSSDKMFSSKLNQYQWYTFDNISYHGTECSVYTEPRRSLVIEFKDINASELCKLLSEYITV